MMETDVQPFASHAGDVPYPEEVVDNAAVQRRAPAEVHETPVMREIQPRLAPKEAWKDPVEDPFQVSVRNNVGKKTKNTPAKQSLWLLRTKRFCYEASVVGLRYVVNPTASPFRRSVWVLLLLAGAAFTTFQIQDRIRYFLTRPVSVSLRMEHADEIRFPTVTICNENRVSYSAAAYNGKIMSLKIHA